jgi:hypothetical protein
MHATMRDERDDARRARGATMRDECEIATGDKTALQSPASWWGFLFWVALMLSEHTYVG